MSKFLSYLWIVLLALYIISPFDAHPLFLDDLIASGVLFWLFYKNAKQKRQQQEYRTWSSSSGQSHQGMKHESKEPLTPDQAYKTLDVEPATPFEEIKKKYKEKIAQSHPDKVTHLSGELQEKARELTLRLNSALDIIKKHRGL
jgi:DnaJ-domain-containing protein 1